MRVAMIMTFAANLALALGSIAVLPGRVAIHFGLGGLPNEWGPSWVSAATLASLATLLFCLIYLTRWLIRVLPAGLINLPNKGYWLSPENRPLAVEKVMQWMHSFGTAMFLFFLIVQGLILHANLSQPVQLYEPAVFASLAGLMAIMIGLVVALYRDFRIPDQSPRA